jgi:hypothetical protein
MFRLSSILLALYVLVLDPFKLVALQSPPGPFLVIMDGKGVTRGGTALMPKAPAKPDEARAGVVLVVPKEDVKNSDGQIITGFGFNAWAEGKGARVIVFMLVPKPGVPNIYLRDRITDLKQVKFASFPMAVGETRTLDEMKPLGLDPMSLRLDAQVGRGGELERP